MYCASLNVKLIVCPESEYAGKVVWITGASSGIGEAMAKEFAKSNAKVVLSARRKDELERVKTECKGKRWN